MKKLIAISIGAVLVISLIFGCSEAPKVAETGDIVKVHYTGKLEDSTVFDSSVGGDPIEFTVGGSMVIPGFDNGVIGMKVGDTRSINIAPSDGYGFPRDELIMVMPKEQFPPNLEFEVGKEVTLRSPDGRPFTFTVLDLMADSVKIDANHPLAGKTLIFEVEMMEIVKPG